MQWFFLCLLVPLAHGLDLFPIPEGLQSLPAGDEISSPAISLSVPIVFYGTSYDSIYVNENGLLSFVRDVATFYNVQFPLTFPVIAPLYSDIDLRRGGLVSFGESTEPGTLERASSHVHDNFPEKAEFSAKSVFVVTYQNVSHFSERENLPVNWFQVVIASDGQESFVTFLYPEGGIQSIRGDGKIQNLADPRAQAGFMSGDGRLLTLPDSGTDRVFNYDKLSNLKNEAPGYWMFRVGAVDQVEPASIRTPGLTCDVIHCPPSATCTPGEGGSCCVCKEGYYGNGENCFKENEAQRINGKVTGNINGQVLHDLDLHAYVLTEDGRSYVAISKVPSEIGPNLQALLTMSDGIGWLFAKTRDGVTNGFSQTGGVFNRTTELEFTRTGDRVTISEQFLGPDVFNSLRATVDIRGSLPTIPPEVKVEFEDYSQEWTYSSSEAETRLRSRSHRVYIPEKGFEVPFTVDQLIIFNECPFKQEEERSMTTRLEVSKTVVIYESNENIVRFGGNYNLRPVSDDDPCKSTECQDHSSCILDGDQAKCVCDRGFRTLSQEADGQVTCVDVNECTSGIHRCHNEANCANLEGGYVCTCNPGFVGDGFYCQRDEANQCEVPCGQNAFCALNPNTNSYGCQCIPGFTGDGITCTGTSRPQVDDPTQLDCKINENICSVDADCSYDIHLERFVCSCNQGFRGNGIDCRPLFPCRVDSNCQTNAHCHFSIGGTGFCDCNPGYNRSADGYQCQPLKDASCNLVKNCHTNAGCIFDRKSRVYKCQCNQGYRGDGRDSCEKLVIPCNIHNTCDIRASCEYNMDHQSFRCQCMEGYMGDGSWCRPIRPCNEDPRQCDSNADCVFVANLQGYSCQCRRGFTGDGLKCSEAPSHDGNYLLFSQGMSILRLPMNPTPEDPGQLVMVLPRQTPVSLDVDCLQGSVYWSDLAMRSIRRAPYNGSRSDIVIEGEQVGSPEGIAIDWISRNVYWTDTINDAVKVTRLDGRIGTKTLITDELHDPRGIVVHPGFGKMYWSDWYRGAAKIETSNMDGSERNLFVSSDLLLPNTLVIDFQTNDLCWTDAGHGRLECMDLSGRGRRVIFTPAAYPFAITIAEDQVFWTDWKTNSVERVNKVGGRGSSLSLPRGGNGKIYGITTVPRECPQMSNACAVNRGGCPQLCLPNGRGGRTCTCPDSDIDVVTGMCRVANK